MVKYILSICVLLLAGCSDNVATTAETTPSKSQTLSVAAAQYDAYVPDLKGKNVGLVVKHMFRAHYSVLYWLIRCTLWRLT